MTHVLAVEIFTVRTLDVDALSCNDARMQSCGRSCMPRTEAAMTQIHDDCKGKLNTGYPRDVCIIL